MRLLNIPLLLKLYPTLSTSHTIYCPYRFKMTDSQGQLKFLTQDEAIKLDQELFTEYGFSVDQLMELAGLSIATIIAKTYSLATHDKPVICCGPGNNGGDGLVCARHLKLFGYKPTVICPKLGRGELFKNLMKQCEKFEIDILHEVPEQPLSSIGNLLVDCVFGFSFKPPNRSLDFAKILHLLHQSSSISPLVSVDIPSGWHVEAGSSVIEESQADLEADLKIPALKPECLISLTSPKLCARSFSGKYHYLGGRFCPKAIQEKYHLNLPRYSDTEGFVLLCNT